MLSQIVYVLALLVELLFFILFSIFTIFLSYSSLKGAPYVPTAKNEADLILKESSLKKNQSFLDLGCGDGRLVRQAVKEYFVYGTGIDVNIIVILIARFLSRVENLKNISFVCANIVTYKLPKVDIIYIFLFPKLISKIEHKLKKQLDQNTLIISHGFEIKNFKSYLKKTINHHPFPTYFYKKTDLN